MRKLIALLGSPLDNLTMEETIERFIHFVAVGRATHKGHQVATVNVDFLVFKPVRFPLEYPFPLFYIRILAGDFWLSFAYNFFP